jgi:hypothetical protein
MAFWLGWVYFAWGRALLSFVRWVWFYHWYTLDWVCILGCLGGYGHRRGHFGLGEVERLNLLPLVFGLWSRTVYYHFIVNSLDGHG